MSDNRSTTEAIAALTHGLAEYRKRQTEMKISNTASFARIMEMMEEMRAEMRSEIRQLKVHETRAEKQPIHQSTPSVTPAPHSTDHTLSSPPLVPTPSDIGECGDTKGPIVDDIHDSKPNTVISYNVSRPTTMKIIVGLTRTLDRQVKVSANSSSVYSLVTQKLRNIASENSYGAKRLQISGYELNGSELSCLPTVCQNASMCWPIVIDARFLKPPAKPPDGVILGKVDVRKEVELPQICDVQEFLTIVLFSNGVHKHSIRQIINEVVTWIKKRTRPTVANVGIVELVRKEHFRSEHRAIKWTKSETAHDSRIGRFAMTLDGQLIAALGCMCAVVRRIGCAHLDTNSLDGIRHNIEAARSSVVDLNQFWEAVQMTALHQFWLCNSYSISEGIMTRVLMNFLKCHLPKIKEGEKPKYSLTILELKMGSHIFQEPKIPCQSNNCLFKWCRCVMFHFDELLRNMTPENLGNAQLGALWHKGYCFGHLSQAAFYMNDISMYSLPRPPECANLEDKVLSEGWSIVTHEGLQDKAGRGARQRMASPKIPVTRIGYGSKQRGEEGKQGVTWTNRLAV